MNNQDIEAIMKKLIEEFPDFISKIQPDDMQPYMLFGDFGIYIRNGIDNNYFNEAELARIFNFLNVMGSSTQDEIHNLLTVGVLEILTDSKMAVKIAKNKLTAGALEDFNAIEKFWYGGAEE